MLGANLPMRKAVIPNSLALASGEGPLFGSIAGF